MHLYLVDDFASSAIKLGILAGLVKLNILPSDRVLQLNFIAELQDLALLFMGTLNFPVDGTVGSIIGHAVHHGKQLCGESKAGFVHSEVVADDGALYADDVLASERFVVGFGGVGELF